jgi:hypothetical protein
MMSPWFIAIVIIVLLFVSLWAAGVFNKNTKAFRLIQQYKSRLGSRVNDPDPLDPTTKYPQWLVTNFNSNYGNNYFLGESFDLRNMNLNQQGTNRPTWYEMIVQAKKTGASGIDVFTRNPTTGILNLADMTNPANYGDGGGNMGCLPYTIDESSTPFITNSSDTTKSTSEITTKLGGSISLPFDLFTVTPTIDSTTTKKTDDTYVYQMASSEFRQPYGYLSMQMSSDSPPKPLDSNPSYCLTNNLNEQFIIDFMNLGLAGAIGGVNTDYGFVGLGKTAGTPQPASDTSIIIPLQASDFVNYNNFLSKYGTHIVNNMHFGNKISLLWNDYSNDTTVSSSVLNSLCVAGQAPASTNENYSRKLGSEVDPANCTSVFSQQSQQTQNSLNNTSVEILGGSASTNSGVLGLLNQGYQGFINPNSSTAISTFLGTPSSDLTYAMEFDFTPIWVILEIAFQTFTAYPPMKWSSSYTPSKWSFSTVSNIENLIVSPSNPYSADNAAYFNMMITNLKLAYTQLNFCQPLMLNGNTSQQLQGFRQVYVDSILNNVPNSQNLWLPVPTGMTSECYTNTGSTPSGDGTGCVSAADCELQSNGWSEPASASALHYMNSLVQVPYGYSCVAGQPQLDPTVMTHVPMGDPLGPTSSQYSSFNDWSSPGDTNAANCGVNAQQKCTFSPTEGKDCHFENGSPICFNTQNFTDTRIVWDAASQLDTCGNIYLS